MNRRTLLIVLALVVVAAFALQGSPFTASAAPQSCSWKLPSGLIKVTGGASPMPGAVLLGCTTPAPPPAEAEVPAVAPEAETEDPVPTEEAAPSEPLGTGEEAQEPTVEPEPAPEPRPDKPDNPRPRNEGNGGNNGGGGGNNGGNDNGNGGGSGGGGGDTGAPDRDDQGQPTLQNPTLSLSTPEPPRIGVPNFFIDKFAIPPFLLPIYQAAGIEYGVPWQVLASINEIETDYGRNLNVSSAGAQGWMQFIPSTWKMYGTDANGDGRADPYNPVDAVFSAARYLKAAGAQDDLRGAIFAYNHAGWYVDQVMLRAKVIGGMPEDLIGSLTGLTQGHFPVYAEARYADDINESAAARRVTSGNAAQTVEGSATRTGINIYAKAGAPAIAVQDGEVIKVGSNDTLGNHIVIQDSYGNRYTYAHLGSVVRMYPAPKDSPREGGRQHAEDEGSAAKDDPKPDAPASAGRQSDRKRPVATDRVTRANGDRPRSTRSAVGLKERLFANPRRPGAWSNGGREQLTETGGIPFRDDATFKNYFSRPYGVDRKDVVLKPLREGAKLIGGTIIGRIGRTSNDTAPHVQFKIQPAGKGSPFIDPKPILDGWKLLEATAVYRAKGKNPLVGSRNATIGQILLMSKEQLERYVLKNPRIEIYSGGENDIKTGQINKRILAVLAFLEASGLRPYVSSLKGNHSFFTSAGGVSDHSSGNAADVAQINGINILGHQGKGSITDTTIRRLLTLQGTMKPHQIISLMKYAGTDNTLAMGDHADHIHIGYPPNLADSKLGKQANAVLKPRQWIKLIERLNNIDNPTVPTRPSDSSTQPSAADERRATATNRDD
jgi:hypothetical protein